MFAHVSAATNASWQAYHSCPIQGHTGGPLQKGLRDDGACASPSQCDSHTRGFLHDQ